MAVTATLGTRSAAAFLYCLSFRRQMRDEMPGDIWHAPGPPPVVVPPAGPGPPPVEPGPPVEPLPVPPGPPLPPGPLAPPPAGDSPMMPEQPAISEQSPTIPHHGRNV